MPNIILLHNSKGVHYVHDAWAKSIGAHYLSDVHPHKLSIPFVLRVFETIADILRVPKGTKLLICESGAYIFVGALWKIFGSNRKTAIILSDPKLYYLQKSNALIKKIYYWALRKYDLLIAVSPMMASYVPSQLASRVCIVPIFYRTKFKVEPGLKNKNILFMARICVEKGVDLLVGAFEKLKEHFPNSNLYLVGASSYLFGQGNLRKVLEKKAMPGIFFTGRVPAVEPYVQKCSIYASLARIDPANASVLEAMSQGLVPVVSKGVGNSYIVEQVSKELVVESQDKAVGIICKLWNSQKLMAAYSKRAVEIAKKYNETASVNAFRSAFRKFFPEVA